MSNENPIPNTRKQPTHPVDWLDAILYASLFPLYFWVWVLL